MFLDEHIAPYLFIRSYFWANIITLIIVISALYLFIVKLINKRKMPWNLIIILGIIGGLYYYYRIRAKCWTCCCFVGEIAYLDVFAAIALGLAIISAFSYIYSNNKSKKAESKKGLIFDSPIEKKEDDKLNYSDVAEKIVEQISALSLEKSFSIGIVAPWGTGKTSFMNLMKKAMADDYIKVDFNPRNSINAQNIQEDFFSVLCAALTPYYYGLSLVIKPYMKALQLMEQNQYVAILSFLYRLQDKESSKEKVGEVLKGLPKKVAIFIEDLDRLLVEEILEVFKLVDVNASFPNIVFITAYDKTIVEMMINNHMHLGDNSNFINKFFDYEVSIPLRPYNMIYGYLKSEILNRFEASYKQQYEAILDSVELLISPHITTLRDAKRFVNLFVSDYEKVEEEVDFEDFLLVSVIKYKSPRTHRMIYVEKAFIQKSVQNRVYGIKSNLSDAEKNSPYIDILRHLFTTKNNGVHPRNVYISIQHMDTFEVYFVTRIYNVSSKKEMKELLKNDNFKLIENKVKVWENTKMIRFFEDYLQARNIFKIIDINEFTSYVKAVLLVFSKDANNDPNNYSVIMRLLYRANVNTLISNKFNDEKNYANFITSCLKQQPKCSNFVGRLIINSLNKVFEKTPIISMDLLNINEQYFGECLTNNPTVGEEHYKIFTNCIKEIDAKTREIKLSATCCKQMKSAIVKSPEWYIKNFVRLTMDSIDAYVNEIGCETYWEQIFEGKESFKNFIKDAKLDKIPKIKCVKNFWRLYEKNGYSPITILGGWGDVQKLIDEDLGKLIKALNEFEAMGKDFEELKRKKATTSMTSKSKDSYMEELKKLQKKLYKNKLDIKYAKDLRRNIQNEINKLHSSNDMYMYP